MNNLIETGKIVNTHGIHGQLRIQPWADSPQALAGVKRFYIDNVPVSVLSAKVHKNCLIVNLDGIDTIEKAITLKNKIINISRDDIELEENKFFIADLIGLNAIDANTGSILGKINDVLTLPAHNVYVINDGKREVLIPAVPEFIIETNIEEGYVKLKMIEGL